MKPPSASYKNATPEQHVGTASNYRPSMKAGVASSPPIHPAFISKMSASGADAASVKPSPSEHSLRSYKGRYGVGAKAPSRPTMEVAAKALTSRPRILGANPVGQRKPVGLRPLAYGSSTFSRKPSTGRYQARLKVQQKQANTRALKNIRSNVGSRMQQGAADRYNPSGKNPLENLLHLGDILKGYSR